jgi:hypothetical protein
MATSLEQRRPHDAPAMTGCYPSMLACPQGPGSADGCVAVVLADLPDGHRMGSRQDNAALYPACSGRPPAWRRLAPPCCW